jgi:hypothetical protein
MNSKKKISRRSALEAKAFVLMALRHGPIENIHAGHTNCPMCGARFSRISDPEMKDIIKLAVDRVATLLMLRETNTEQYEKLVVWALGYVRSWDDPEIVWDYLRGAVGGADCDDLGGSMQ